MTLGYLPGCCAVQEIRYLNQHANSKEAMVAFCKALFVKTARFDFHSNRYIKDGKPNYSRKVDAHFVFTGVEGYTKAERYGGKSKYGSQFAAYIKENKLGTVVQTNQAPNRMNHPTHKVCAWIWTPAPTLLREWAKKNIEGNPNG